MSKLFECEKPLRRKDLNSAKSVMWNNYGSFPHIVAILSWQKHVHVSIKNNEKIMITIVVGELTFEEK